MISSHLVERVTRGGVIGTRGELTIKHATVVLVVTSLVFRESGDRIYFLVNLCGNRVLWLTENVELLPRMADLGCSVRDDDPHIHSLRAYLPGDGIPRISAM